MSNRFKYVECDEEECYDPCLVLVDTKNDREIATDTAAPEDANFYRHYAFMTRELNLLDDEIETLLDLLAETLEGVGDGPLMDDIQAVFKRNNRDSNGNRSD